MKKGIYLSLLLFSLFIGITNVNAASYESTKVGLSTFKYNWCILNTSVSTGPSAFSCSYDFVSIGSYDIWTSGSPYEGSPRAFGGFFLQTQSLDSERFYNGEEYVLIMTLRLKGIPNIGNLKFSGSGARGGYNLNANNVNVKSSEITKLNNTDYKVTINFVPTETFTHLYISANNEVSSDIVYSPGNSPSEFLIYSGVQISIGLTDFSISRYISDTHESNNKLDNIGNKQDETNSKLNDIKDMDIDSTEKELPDDSKYQDYQDSENSLKDKVNQADLNYLEIGMDNKSSLFIWDTITKIIQSHPAIFAMVTSILSIGIIKLALGR